MEGVVKFLKPKDFELAENYADEIIKVKHISKGDVFYECEKGYNFELRALEDAKKVKGGYSCRVMNMNGEEIELFMAEHTSHVGPNLFKNPQFLTQDVEKGYGFIIC